MRVCVYVLTVAMVAGVDASLQRLGLRELGQHLYEGAALEAQRARSLLPTVVALWELQGQVPERLYRVGLVLAGKTRHLEATERERETITQIFPEFQHLNDLDRLSVLLGEREDCCRICISLPRAPE